MKRADARKWQAARTLADLSALTAQWLEGDLRSQPAYQPDCGPEDETRDLIPTLAKVNRAGYMTSCSQPGTEVSWYHGTRCHQRAAVNGFADDAMLYRITQAVRGTDVVMIVNRVDQPGPRDRVMVTIDAGKPFTWFGAWLSRDDITYLYEGLHQSAIKALCRSWQITLVDEKWGRNDLLWPLLGKVAS